MRVEPRIAAQVPTAQAATAAGPAATARRTETAPAFTLAEAQGRTASAAAAQTGMLSGLDAILTLQAGAGEDAPGERRRRSVRRGNDLLDGLDRLKAALLGGRVAAQELRAIAARLAERSEASGDPRLDALVAEIELRTAVEIAKLEAARGLRA